MYLLFTCVVFIGALTLGGVISSMFALYLQLYDAGSVDLKRYSSNLFVIYPHPYLLYLQGLMKGSLFEGLGFSVPNTFKYCPAEYIISVYNYCGEFLF